MAVKYLGKEGVHSFHPFSETSIFGLLNISKIETYQESGGVLVAILTFQVKKSKKILESCILDYNQWFPESPIQIQEQILCLNRSSKEEANCFNEITARFHSLLETTSIMATYWIKYLGTVSEHARYVKNIDDVVVIYHQRNSSDEKKPCFLEFQKAGCCMVFWNGKNKENITSSEMRHIQIQDHIFILHLKLTSKTSTPSMFNKVIGFMESLSLNPMEFSLTTKLQQPSPIEKCGIYLPGDPDYAIARQALLGSSPCQCCLSNK
jgi:hypothetical protein